MPGLFEIRQSRCDISGPTRLEIGGAVDRYRFGWV
jgi:hypothetical protein